MFIKDPTAPHMRRYTTCETLMSENERQSQTNAVINDKLQGTVKKAKFSHTRYRALGPELIPVYRQSARR